MSLSRRDTASGQCEGTLVVTEESPWLRKRFFAEFILSVSKAQNDEMRRDCFVGKSTLLTMT
jgi:hypothetical protein